MDPHNLYSAQGRRTRLPEEVGDVFFRDALPEASDAAHVNCLRRSPRVVRAGRVVVTPRKTPRVHLHRGGSASTRGKLSDLQTWYREPH